MQIVKRMRQEGLMDVANDFDEARKNARGRRKERIVEYIRYLEGNQNSLKDVQISENGRTLSPGGIEGMLINWLQGE